MAPSRAHNQCLTQRGVRAPSPGRDTSTDLLLWGLAVSLLGSKFTPEREAGSQRNANMATPVRGQSQGSPGRWAAEEGDVFETYKQSIWALSWSCLVCSNHENPPKHLPKASCKFTDTLTLPAMGQSTSLDLDSLASTSMTSGQLIPKPELERCWQATALLLRRALPVGSTRAVGGQSGGIQFSSVPAQINTSCFPSGS